MDKVVSVIYPLTFLSRLKEKQNRGTGTDSTRRAAGDPEKRMTRMPQTWMSPEVYIKPKKSLHWESHLFVPMTVSPVCPVGFDTSIPTSWG